MKANKLFKALILFILLSLTACDLGWRTLGASEFAVKFRILPPILGGGLSSNAYTPGQLVFVLPWETLYRFDTRIRTLEWGASTKNDPKELAHNYVQTRALDGNEISLAVKIEYRIATESARLNNLIQNVGTSNEEIDEIIVAAAQADIRTHMNKLKTSEFFNNEAKYRGEAEVRDALQKRLGRYSIEIVSVNLKEHRFERILPDGQIDRSYQEKINEVQKKEQDTQREELRIATITADKQREFNEAKAQYNRVIAEAEGIKNQAVLRADGYFQAKSNEAEGVLASGQAKAEGLKEQIEALAGAGGIEILKMDIAEQIKKSESKFVTIQSADASNGINVNRIDSNQLIEQIGLIESLRESSEKNNSQVNKKNDLGKK